MRPTLRRLPLPTLFALLLRAAVLSAVELSAAEQRPPSFVLARLAGKVTLDGDPSEEAWKSAVVVDRFWENAPGEAAEPPVATVGLLAYDSEFLYVAIRCADPVPAKLRAPWVERDHVFDQDLVQVEVDARDEGRWEMIFRVNPHGVQADGIFDESAGADDYSPDFHWESATRIGADGWTVEMRIPLSTLRYRAGDSQTWRISFFRLYPRKYRYQLASMPIPRGSNCWTCHMPRFTGISGLGRSRNVTVTPFVTAGASDGPDASEGGTNLDGGADLKWLPDPNLAVDLALNPDFSQVESDAPQIAVNNRFALFFPEKRPFFLEGSDLWNSPIQAISTRTITDPDWGARLTGRPGDASYTLLASGDRGGGTLILPGPDGSSSVAQPESTKVLLGRFQRTLGRSSIGALGTVRDGAGGYFNRLGGLDLQSYPTGTDRLIAQALWSSTRDPGASAVDDHALFLRWEKSLSHLVWTLQADELGRDFRADSGFVPQTGIRHVQGYTEYNWYPEGTIRHIWPRLYFDEAREIRGGIVSRAPALGLGIDGRLKAVLDRYVGAQERAADGRIFEENYWNLALRWLPSRRVPLVTMNARWGDALDIAGSSPGTGGDVAAAVTINAERLQAELSGERRWLGLSRQGGESRLFTATVARTRLTYAFSTRTFVRLIGEWERLDRRDGGGMASHTFNGSALYGYQLNWQSILYLGYDNSPASTSAGPSGRSQELFLKVAYAFRP